MSLPRRPSVGLPSSPRARSFNGQARRDIPLRPRSSASERPPPRFEPSPPLPPYARSLRPQRSVGNLPERPTSTVRSRSLGRTDSRHVSSRSDPPPPLPSLPSLPRSPRHVSNPRREGALAHASGLSADYDAYRKREDRISNSTSSSSASNDPRSPVSAASSRTSLDEEEMDDGKMDKKPPAGFGSSLWGNITGVAGNLTISVSKAWSTKVASFSGEETPPGGESRLTRAMKAYHIEKARDPSDLPDWLFDERERGVGTERSGSGPPSDKVQSRPLTRSTTAVKRDDALSDFESIPPVRVLRGPTLADRKRATTRADIDSGSAAHITKSMVRLRELRDAKRTAKVRFGGTEDIDDDPPAAEQELVRLPPPMRPRGVPSTLPPPSASLGVRGRQPSARVGLPTSVRPVRG